MRRISIWIVAAKCLVSISIFRTSTFPQSVQMLLGFFKQLYQLREITFTTGQIEVLEFCAVTVHVNDWGEGQFFVVCWRWIPFFRADNPILNMRDH